MVSVQVPEVVEPLILQTHRLAIDIIDLIVYWKLKKNVEKGL